MKEIIAKPALCYNIQWIFFLHLHEYLNNIDMCCFGEPDTLNELIVLGSLQGQKIENQQEIISCREIAPFLIRPFMFQKDNLKSIWK